jgi:hypothetical protein
VDYDDQHRRAGSAISRPTESLVFTVVAVVRVGESSPGRRLSAVFPATPSVAGSPEKVNKAFNFYRCGARKTLAPLTDKTVKTKQRTETGQS